LRDSDMPFEEDSLDIYFEETLNQQPCQCLEVLFGPKLIKRIDMFARLKEFLPLHRHNFFPGGWHTLGAWDDDESSYDSSSQNGDPIHGHISDIDMQEDRSDESSYDSSSKNGDYPWVYQ
jgi:hypothetical protein